MVLLGHKTMCQISALVVRTLPCLFNAPLETGFENVCLWQLHLCHSSYSTTEFLVTGTN